MTKLVFEKEENKGTAAKAGLFWAFITVPLVLWRYLRRRSK